jgi:hypothetical protein
LKEERREGEGEGEGSNKKLWKSPSKAPLNMYLPVALLLDSRLEYQLRIPGVARKRNLSGRVE